MDNARDALAGLLEAEKPTLMNQLTEDRSPQAVQTALERTLDRVTYRYAEICPDPKLAASGQAMLSSLKAVLPLLTSVNDAHEWKLTATGEKKPKLAGLNLALLVGGAVLLAAGALGMYFAPGAGAVLGLLRALVPSALGGGMLFLSGLRAGKPAKGPDAEIRREFLVDPETAWHALRGTMVVADGELNALRERAAVEAVADRNPASLGPLTGPEAELLSSLLEAAYAHRDDADAVEMIADIRFYLHGKGVDMTDYDPDHAMWFELLPAPQSGTLRPALVQEGRLLKKGLASSSGPARV